MEYYNGYFLAKFYIIIKDIFNESNMNNPIDKLNVLEKEIQIKIMYKTYKTNKNLVNLSRILRIKSENGNQFELDLQLEIKKIALYDKFMELFIKENLDKEKVILIEKDELIKFSDLVFKFDLVLPIKKYIIDTLIEYYTFFSIRELECIANTYQIKVLKDFITELNVNFNYLALKALSLPKNESKTTNLKINEQIYRNFFRSIYLSCLLQKKKYPYVKSIIGSSNKNIFFKTGNKLNSGLQQILLIKNSGFLNINKFIAEKLNLNLINKKKKTSGSLKGDINMLNQLNLNLNSLSNISIGICNSNSNNNPNKNVLNNFTNVNKSNNAFISYDNINNSNTRRKMCKNNKLFKIKTIKAIFLQKYIRRLLAISKFQLFNLYKFKPLFLYHIVKIQSKFRQRTQFRYLKKKFLLNKIVLERYTKANKIEMLFKQFLFINRLKRLVLIRKIIKYRLDSCNLIQSQYKAYKFRNKILKILHKEKNAVKFTYPFKAKEVKLLLYLVPEKSFDYLVIKKFKFEFCDIQSMLVLYLNSSQLSQGKYKAQLEVDGFRTCDGRYPHFEAKDGYYYNVIDINNNISKNNMVPVYQNEFIDIEENELYTKQVNTSKGKDKGKDKGKGKDSNSKVVNNEGKEGKEGKNGKNGKISKGKGSASPIRLSIYDVSEIDKSENQNLNDNKRNNIQIIDIDSSFDSKSSNKVVNQKNSSKSLVMDNNRVFSFEQNEDKNLIDNNANMISSDNINTYKNLSFSSRTAQKNLGKLEGLKFQQPFDFMKEITFDFDDYQD